MAEDVYSNIRKVIGQFIGKKVVDITQHDKEDYDEAEDNAFVELMFEDGSTLKFWVGDKGFIWSD